MFIDIEGATSKSILSYFWFSLSNIQEEVVLECQNNKILTKTGNLYSLIIPSTLETEIIIQSVIPTSLNSASIVAHGLMTSICKIVGSSFFYSKCLLIFQLFRSFCVTSVAFQFWQTAIALHFISTSSSSSPVGNLSFLSVCYKLVLLSKLESCFWSND